MGDWTADTQGLTELSVDVEHLSNITSYLNTLSNAISSDLRPAVYEANRLASTGGDDSRSALGAPEIPVVGDLHKRIEATYQAVDNTLKSLAEQLRKDGEAITTIAEKYRTAEDRNHANALDFQSALGSAK